jgi:mannose-1-phosphate guanylyltransferase
LLTLTPTEELMNWIAIMAGGGGTRLWPLSRRSRPKQFLSLLEGGESLLAATLRRLVVVATRESVLVIPRERAQEVRRVVEALEKQGRTRAL